MDAEIWGYAVSKHGEDGLGVVREAWVGLLAKTHGRGADARQKNLAGRNEIGMNFTQCLAGKKMDGPCREKMQWPTKPTHLT